MKRFILAANLSITFSILITSLPITCARAQIVVNTAATPAQMVATLVGPGITYSNVTFTGDGVATAIFNGGGNTIPNLGMASGVVLTTGKADLIPVNNGGSQGFNNTGPAIPELNAIAGANTFDGAILEFDFVPQAANLNVDYIFGSDEYLEWVNFGYNDAFAFFISGPGIIGEVNIATSGGLPVTIDNINTVQNNTFFINNTSSGNGPLTIEYDGFTSLLTASQAVIPCSTYHIRLMIADGGDAIYDSGVFIEENGFYSVGATTTVGIQHAFGFSTGIEGCYGTNFVFTIPTALTTNTIINYTISGTAIPGVDYVPIPTNFVIPAGQTHALLPVTIFNDGITEGTETISLTVNITTCSSETYSLQIIDPTPISLSSTNALFCYGQGPVNISATGTGGNGIISYSWNNGTGNDSMVSVNPSTTTTYMVTATDLCGKTATSNSTVTVNPNITPTFAAIEPYCSGASIPALPTTSTNGLTGIWSPEINNMSTTTYSFNPTAGQCASATNQTITINPNITPTFNAIPAICQNLTAPILPTISNNGFTGTWSTTVTPSSSGSTTYTFSPTAGQCALSTALNLTVNPVYSGGIQNEVICQGESFTFGGTAYTVSGNYPFTFQTINGCDSTVTLNLTVNPVYNGGVQNEVICDGDSFAFGGTAYTTSGNYPNTFTTLNGCDSTVTLNLTVNPLPSTPLLSGDFAVCAEDNINLTAGSSAGASYFWTGPNSFTSSIHNPIITNATILNQGTYQVYTVLNQCTSAVSVVNVIVNDVPDFTIIPGGLTVCESGTITLDAPNVIGASYLWTGPNNYTSTEQNPTLSNVSSSMAGSYSTTVTMNGCNYLVNIINITVTSTPIAPSASSNSPICENSELMLNANSAYNATYYWNGPNGFTANSSNTSIPSVILSDAGQYNIYYVTAGCTSSTATLTVAVTPAPTANFAITPQICYGADGFALYNGNAGSEATYCWSTSNGGSVSGNGTGPITFNWIDAGAQSVTLVVNQNGCPSLPFTQNLVVLESIMPNAGPDQTICSGSIVSIGSTTQPNATFNWLTPYGISDITSGYTTGTWTNEGTESVTIILTLQAQNQGCTSTDQVEITIIPIPVAQISAPAPQCLFGNSFDFTAGGNYLQQATFNWSFTNSAQGGSAAQNPSGIQFLTSGEQIITLVISQYGCQSVPTTNHVLVNQGPTAAFAYTPGKGCIPMEVQFTDLSQSEIGITGYTWQFGTGAASFETSPEYTYTQAGIYTVTFTVADALGCSSEVVMSNIIRVYEGPTADFSASPKIMYIDEPITFIQDGSLGNVASWNYTVSNGAQFFTPDFTTNFSDTGTYTITQTVNSEEGCSDISEVEVIVKPIPLIFVPSAFTPYGNDNLNEAFKPYGLNIKNFRMYIYNRWGELLFSTEDLEEGWDGQVRNSDVEAKQDVYVYKLEYDDRFGNPQQLIGNVTLLR